MKNPFRRLKEAPARFRDWFYNYDIYTTEFDLEIPASQIDDIIGKRDKPEWEQEVAKYRKKSKRWKKEAQASFAKLHQKTPELTADDAVVSLLIDHSGSMRGKPAMLACGLSEVFAEYCEHIGVKYEILGFTTSSWKGGRSRKSWLASGGPPHCGRLCDLLHIVYRDADSGPQKQPAPILNMMRAPLLKENVDGEAIQWAAKRLRSRPEARKILIVVSDGAPVDDSTLSVNLHTILSNHVIKVISGIERAGDVSIAAVGINHDVSRYYTNCVVLKRPRAVGTRFPAFLSNLLRPPHSP